MFKKISLFVVAIVIGLSAASFVHAQSVSDLQAQITALLAQITQLQAQIKNQGGGTSNTFCYTFNNNLSIGSSGNDVAALQTALTKEGFTISSSDTNSDTFGESTASAVTGFQEKYSSDVLKPFGLNYGTGFAGKGTRAKLNSLYGCGPSQLPVVNPPQQGNVSISTISPSTGAIGSSVTIYGSGFDSDKNTIKFGKGYINGVKADIGGAKLLDSITFTVPSGMGICPDSYDSNSSSTQVCATVEMMVSAGTYPISVINQNGQSNSINFTVTSETNPPIGGITVTSPAAGDVWYTGNTYKILWSSGMSPDAKVQITLNYPRLACLDANPPCMVAQPLVAQKLTLPYTIAASVENDGSYEWTVPADLSGVYIGSQQITVQTINGSTYGRSTTFTISSGPTVIPTTQIKITSPVAGDVWKVGGTYNINWTSNSSLSDYEVKISLIPVPVGPTCSPGATCPLSISMPLIKPYVISESTDNNGQFSWTVPSDFMGFYTGQEQIMIEQVMANDSYGGTPAYGKSGIFTITSGSVANNQSPVISGVSGPTTLSVGQQGTWAVKASDPNNGTLSYSVVWGDEIHNLYQTTNLPAATPVQQSATFTHVYNTAGSFTPKFTVSNISGLSAQTSVSVAVGNQVSSKTITVISPVTDQTYTAGSVINIIWTSTGGVGPVDIFAWPSVSCAPGVACMPAPISIASKIGNSGSYSWTIPQSWSGAYSINIYEDGSTNTSGSSGKFNIVSSSTNQFNITYPTAGTTVVQGQTYNITWSGADTGVTGYDIYLGGGSLMNTIPPTIKKLGTVAIGSGYPKSFAWTVGSDVGTGSNYYIQFGAIGGNGGGGGMSSAFNITAISSPFPPVSTTTVSQSSVSSYSQMANILNTASATLQNILNLLK